MYVCMYVCMYCMYVCMYVCMYQVCMYVGMYIDKIPGTLWLIVGKSILKTTAVVLLNNCCSSSVGTLVKRTCSIRVGIGYRILYYMYVRSMWKTFNRCVWSMNEDGYIWRWRCCRKCVRNNIIIEGSSNTVHQQVAAACIACLLLCHYYTINRARMTAACPASSIFYVHILYLLLAVGLLRQLPSRPHLALGQARG